MEINIEEIYHDYLNSVNTLERLKIQSMPGYFGASGAGMCFLKQMFKDAKKEVDCDRCNGTSEIEITDKQILEHQMIKPLAVIERENLKFVICDNCENGKIIVSEYKPSEINPKNVRNMRLGTLVHTDIQNAIIGFSNKNNDIDIKVEEHIVIEDIKVRGYIDISIVNHVEKTIEVYDIKTVHSFKWKLMYGQTKNRERNPVPIAELQVGTYTIAKLQEFKGYTFNMYLVHYKKDDTTIRIKYVDRSFLYTALQYWKEFKLFREENKIVDVVGGLSVNSPMYPWECKREYCRYTDYCTSQYIK